MALQSQLEEITRECFLLNLEIIVPLVVTYKQSSHNPIPWRTPLKVSNMKKTIQKHCIIQKEKKAKMPVLMMPVQWIHDKIPFFSPSSIRLLLQNTAIIVIPHFTLQYLLVAL